MAAQLGRPTSDEPNMRQVLVGFPPALIQTLNRLSFASEPKRSRAEIIRGFIMQGLADLANSSKEVR
jgi:hypothetical protein